MIKLFSLKQQKQQEKEESGGDGGREGDGTGRSSENGAGRTSKSQKKTTAAQIRLQKDLAELELPSSMKLETPDPNNLLEFSLIVTPDEGFYVGGKFEFKFKFKNSYPHDPPKVSCVPTIYHPNIDLEGAVCLNILREDWKPVLNLQSIAVGLQFLFLEPNPDDPLNKGGFALMHGVRVVAVLIVSVRVFVDAANLLRQDKKRFLDNVKMTMNGASLNGTRFDRVVWQ